MNAVEIERAITDLAEQPFDTREIPVRAFSRRQIASRTWATGLLAVTGSRVHKFPGVRSVIPTDVGGSYLSRSASQDEGGMSAVLTPSAAEG